MRRALFNFSKAVHPGEAPSVRPTYPPEKGIPSQRISTLPGTAAWIEHNKEKRGKETDFSTARVLGFETANFRELRNLISLVQ